MKKTSQLRNLHVHHTQFYGISVAMSSFLSRINNDLLLWEPTAPSPVETVENIPYGVGLSVASQLINTYSKDSFSQFRSTGPEGKDLLPPLCSLEYLISD